MLELYRKNVKHMMRAYEVRCASSRIFSEAHIRQAKLVTLCYAIREEWLAKRNMAWKSKDGADTFVGIEMRPHPAFPATEERDAKTGTRMAARLLDNSPSLLILDGGVKDEARIMEKAGGPDMPNIHKVNDINRLTVASNNPLLLSYFSKCLCQAASGDLFCAKPFWEFKRFGTLSRTNYVMIDDVPCQVHLSEVKQVQVSRAMTHHMYEVTRIETSRQDNAHRFEALFFNLPEAVSHSIAAHASNMPPQDVECLKEYLEALSTLVHRHKRSGIEDKRQDLILLQQEIHSRFFERAGGAWKRIYDRARRAYEGSHRRSQVACAEI